VHRRRREGTLVILSDVHSQPVVALTNSGLFADLGEENVTGNIDDVLNRARAHRHRASE
jgi:SulP family sulfate permease